MFIAHILFRNHESVSSFMGMLDPSDSLTIKLITGDNGNVERYLGIYTSPINQTLSKDSVCPDDQILYQEYYECSYTTVKSTMKVENLKHNQLFQIPGEKYIFQYRRDGSDEFGDYRVWIVGRIKDDGTIKIVPQELDHIHWSTSIELIELKIEK